MEKDVVLPVEAELRLTHPIRFPEEMKFTLPDGGTLPAWPVTAPEIAIAANGEDDEDFAVTVSEVGVVFGAAATTTLTDAELPK
jgi:hypothetical protein